MRDARLVFVAAHPDDETFRCGGTLALIARRGVVVQVLTATRGEAGQEHFVRAVGLRDTDFLLELGKHQTG